MYEIWKFLWLQFKLKEIESGLLLAIVNSKHRIHKSITHMSHHCQQGISDRLTFLSFTMKSSAYKQLLLQEMTEVWKDWNASSWQKSTKQRGRIGEIPTESLKTTLTSLMTFTWHFMIWELGKGAFLQQTSSCASGELSSADEHNYDQTIPRMNSHCSLPILRSGSTWSSSILRARLTHHRKDGRSGNTPSFSAAELVQQTVQRWSRVDINRRQRTRSRPVVTTVSCWLMEGVFDNTDWLSK